MALTNINALKIDYCRGLQYDWRDCPDGSIIVIDEIQNVDPFNDFKSKAKLINDLTIHRHRGFDFYIITQYPSLLHPTVKVLVGIHYHLTKPYGMKTIVYQHGSAKDNPNALVNRKNIETKFFFTPQDRIFKLYKSTTINTHKKRFPKGILFFIVWVLLGVGFFIYTLLSGDINKSSMIGEDNKAKPSNQVVTTTTTTVKETADQETVSIAADQDRKVLHEKYLNEYTVEVADDPVILPAIVISMGGQCRAYNTYGDLLNVDNDYCNWMLNDAGRIPKKRDRDIGANNPFVLQNEPLVTNNDESLVKIN